MSKRRRPWRPGSGRSLTLLVTVGAALLTLGNACPTTNPLAADGCNCKPPETACCVSHNRCCKPEFPHHCAETSKCYKYFTDAQAACGNNYELCGGPVGVASPAASDVDTGSIELRAVGDQECMADFE